MHFRVGVDTGSAPAAWATAPSEEVVTVVEDTCLEPLDLLLPDDPKKQAYEFDFFFSPSYRGYESSQQIYGLALINIVCFFFHFLFEKLGPS